MSAEKESSIRLAESAGRQVVRMEGALRLGNVAQWQQTLIAALERGQPIDIDVAGVTDLDLCGMQLLCSAHRTFTGRGLTIELKGAPQWFWEKAGEAGFDACKSVCSWGREGVCLWNHPGLQNCSLA